MDRIDQRPVLKAAAAALLLTAALGLGACTSDQAHEYLAHTDRVTSGSGDASASNSAVHTIDPWPKHSQKTRIDMDGKRAGLAVRKYESNTSAAPKGLGSDPPLIINGNGAPKN